MSQADDFDNVHPLPVPNEQAMGDHLKHLFGSLPSYYEDGLIELAWTHNIKEHGRHDLKWGRQYPLDQLNELIKDAVRINQNEFQNVYIGAALRKPGTPRGKRAGDDDVYAAPGLYADLDDEGSVARAKPLYAAAKPTLVVVTGLKPYKRGQCWWLLDDPMTDHDEIRAALKGIANVLGSDASVCNPGRVMRLAGSIAWPIKEGRTDVELTHIAPLKEPGEACYSAERLEEVFPPVDDADPGFDTTGADEGITRDKNAFGHDDKVDDGREKYMRDTIVACLADFICVNSRAPTAQELFDASWPQYAEKTKLDRTPRARGAQAYVRKCAYTVRRYHRGVIRHCRNAAEARQYHKGDRPSGAYQRQKPKSDDDEFGADSKPSQEGAKPYPTLSIDDIMDRPDPVWAVEGLISERNLGFIYGPPGSLKTFIALDIALSIVTKMISWWGRTIKTDGAVIYLCREGTRSLKLRIQAWERHRKAQARGKHFRLVEHPTNFMNQDDVARVIATIKAVAAETSAPISAIFVDTVSRVLPGAEENLQRDMSLFTAACEQIQMEFNCHVIGVHHTNKSGEIRGSSVIPGAGDFLLGTKREPGAMTGELWVEKVKDGEDGFAIPFGVTSIDGLGAVGDKSSLVVDETVATTAKAKDGWPDAAACRDILAAIDEAWVAGKPFSYSSNTARSAVMYIMKRWRLGRAVAKDVIDTWLTSGMIEEELHSSKGKVKGLRKVFGF